AATYQKGSIREARARVGESSTAKPCLVPRQGADRPVGQPARPRAGLDWDAVLTSGDYKEAFPDAARAKHPDAGRTWRAPPAVTAGTAGGGWGAGPARDRPRSVPGAAADPGSCRPARVRLARRRILDGAARLFPGRQRGPHGLRPPVGGSP